MVVILLLRSRHIKVLQEQTNSKLCTETIFRESSPYAHPKFFSGIKQYETTLEWDEGGGGAGLVGVGVVLLLAGVGGSFNPCGKNTPRHVTDHHACDNWNTAT